jgi:arylsulfatase A-like enzyme
MHIIFYVLDSLRADHLSCYGYHRKTSPHIDSIAGDGVIFQKCYSTSTWTRPVAASILSGTYPAINGVQGRNDYFDSRIFRLPESLKCQEFQTACISAIGNVSTNFGFSRGFDYFCDLYKEPSLIKMREKSSGTAEGLEDEGDSEVIFPLAGDLNSFFFPWLETKREKNTFSLLWSIQTHEPYLPPREYNKFIDPNYDGKFAGHRDMIRRVKSKEDTKNLIDLYDGEIYYNDACIGELINYLKENNLYEDSLLVITGDHGESLGEHGIYSHGHLPYEQVARVPLIIKFPKNEYAGKSINQLVSLMDLFPSITDYLNIHLSEDIHEFIKGKSIIQLIREDHYLNHQYLFAETRYSDAKPIFQAVISNEYKYIKVIPTRVQASIIKMTLKRLINEGIWLSILRNPLYMFKRYGHIETRQLFNLESDPGENQNLVGDQPEIVERMEKLLLEWEDDCRRQSIPRSPNDSNQEDEELIRQQLRALGYME